MYHQKDCDDIEEEVDQEVRVPNEVIDAALDHLNGNARMIPTACQNSSNFRISYINLNAVMDEE